MALFRCANVLFKEIGSRDAERVRQSRELLSRRPLRFPVLEFPKVAFAEPSQVSQLIKRQSTLLAQFAQLLAETCCHGPSPVQV